MAIYLRNCTNQAYVFNYRLDYKDPAHVTLADRRNFKQVQVRPFSKAEITVDKVMETDVIDQLRQAGHFSEQDVPNRLEGFVPLLFSTERPVNPRAAQAVIDHNRELKFHEGVERRKKAAVAANDAVIQQLNEHGHLNNAPPSDFEVEVEQTVDSEMEDQGKRIEEGFRVKADARSKASKRA